MEFVKIETRRNGYSVGQCGSTMTVAELIECLNQYDEDMPVYFSNDDGYTYGDIREYDIECGYED